MIWSMVSPPTSKSERHPFRTSSFEFLLEILGLEFLHTSGKVSNRRGGYHQVGLCGSPRLCPPAPLMSRVRLITPLRAAEDTLLPMLCHSSSPSGCDHPPVFSEFGGWMWLTFNSDRLRRLECHGRIIRQS